MDEHDRENSLRFSPEDINWVPNTSAYGLHGDHYEYQFYMNPMSNGMYHQEPSLAPQWMHCKQTPQNYVEFPAESGYPEFQKQMPHEISTQISSSGLADSSQLEEHPFLRNFVTTFNGLEPEYGVQRENWNAEYSHTAFQAYSESGTAVPKCASKSRREISKEKACAADRCRRLKISHWLDALKELVPHSDEGGKGALLDAVFDHVELLQNQVKDLCRSRLGSESALNPLIYLEGHGHYLVHEHMIHGPLEQMMGKLFDAHPSAATELLQSRGLKVMPMTLAEELLDMQENGGRASNPQTNRRVNMVCRNFWDMQTPCDPSA